MELSTHTSSPTLSPLTADQTIPWECQFNPYNRCTYAASVRETCAAELAGRGWLTELAGGRTPWLLGGGAAVTGMYYLYCLETIPYIGRRHSLILMSRQQEKSTRNSKIWFETVRSGGGSRRWACKLVFKMVTSIEFEMVRREAAAEAPHVVRTLAYHKRCTRACLRYFFAIRPAHCHRIISHLSGTEPQRDRYRASPISSTHLTLSQAHTSSRPPPTGMQRGKAEANAAP